MIKCAFSECGEMFEPTTHNQKYHTPECCRRATNSRIMDNYYAKKARRGGSVRVCSTPGCETKLSRYNDGTTCQKCDAAKGQETRNKLLNMLTG
jgi:hypothetical protein